MKLMTVTDIAEKYEVPRWRLAKIVHRTSPVPAQMAGRTALYALAEQQAIGNAARRQEGLPILCAPQCAESERSEN